MKSEAIADLTTIFEGHAQQTETSVEYWLARDIQHLLGYAKWDSFRTVPGKAKTACEVSGHDIRDHFADVGKMVDLGLAIRPESLPPDEDIRKVERRVAADERKSLAAPKRLEG
jgi:DNA-damage-inducible protein D